MELSARILWSLQLHKQCFACCSGQAEVLMGDVPHLTLLQSSCLLHLRIQPQLHNLIGHPSKLQGGNCNLLFPLCMLATQTLCCHSGCHSGLSRPHFHTTFWKAYQDLWDGLMPDCWQQDSLGAAIGAASRCFHSTTYCCLLNLNRINVLLTGQGTDKWEGKQCRTGVIFCQTGTVLTFMDYFDHILLR